MQIIKIKLALSNAYLIKGRKSILVDAGAPKEADKILIAIKKAGVNPHDISLLLHTHGHMDHAGSTAELKRRLNLPIAIHSSDAFMLRNGENGLVKPVGLEARLVKALIPNSFEKRSPDIVITEEISLNDFGVDGKVFFTPGHTKGSISILFDNQEAIIGDLMMGGTMGGVLFGSTPNYHYFIDDINELHASIKKLIGLKPKKVYVGHGGPLLMEDVIRRFEKVIN